MLVKYFVLFIALLLILRYYIFTRNNVCKTFWDYLYSDVSEKCHYDPDATLKTPEIIQKYAGIVETHDVITEDGYVLTMFRIPRNKPREVILIHHSIAVYSHVYLWQGNDSLALTLWHNGYDVWLANHRGTSYSEKHVNMTSSDYQYWDFSFHEMGIYDVSSEVEYIRKKTNDMKIIFMGHSLGSAVGLVYASVLSAKAQNYLKSLILVAAPVYFGHSANIVIQLPKIFRTSLRVVADYLHIGSPVFLLPLILPVSKFILRLFPFLPFVASVFVWILCGYTPNETDPAFFNFDAALYVNKFSMKTLLHFAQIADTNNQFQMYDYGTEENLRTYGVDTPPMFPVENISVPTLLISNSDDSLVTLKDCEILFERLPPKAKIYGHWKFSGWNHIDGIVGKNRQIFTKKLLRFLNQEVVK